MKLIDTPLPGLFLMEPEMISDARGFFARTWSVDVLSGLCPGFSAVQSSISFSAVAHTLRGMHWQAGPNAESKLVRVTQGAVFDVAVDLREDSPTRLSWFATELSAANRRSMLIPRGFAHGLLTLTDATEVLYVMDVAYAAGSARGARFDDPALGIEWPALPTVIGQRDLEWPPLGSSA